MSISLRRIVLALCSGACVAASAAPLAGAAQADTTPAADETTLEARMLAITSELRCVVCQNETVGGSSAALAEDLRREVRVMLRRGESRERILDHMSARYGDFVLYRPPFKASTVLLWTGPGLLFAGGALVMVRVLRKRGRLAHDRSGWEESEG